MAFESIHVKGRWHPQKPRPERKHGIGGIAIKNSIERSEQQIHGGKSRVGKRVQILMTNRGQIAKLHAAVFTARGLLAAINGNGMPARGQPYRDLFRKRLKSPIIGRNPAGTQQCDTHSAGTALWGRLQKGALWARPVAKSALEPCGNLDVRCAAAAHNFAALPPCPAPDSKYQPKGFQRPEFPQ